MTRNALPSKLVLALAFTQMVGACASQDLELSAEHADVHDLLFDSEGYKNNPLEVEFQGPFDMCFSNVENASPYNGYGLDLNTAKWLSFISANEYAHYARFAPVIEQMGFGDPGEGEDWVEQGRAVLRRRQLVQAGKFEKLESAEFERDLVQKVVAGKKVQFFAAGVIEADEFKDESTQVLWMEHATEPVVIIGFRGTQFDKFEDIGADLKVIRVDVDGYGAVHRGFLGAYVGIRDILKAKLEAESGRNLQIWVTGHSLGASLANLASATILEHLKTDSSYAFKGVYTFGQPRVGNSDFVKAVEEGFDRHGFKLMRFRHGDDAVTQLPWAWLGYEQVGKLIHMTKAALDFNPLDQDPGDTAEVEGAFADHFIATHYYPAILGHLADDTEGLISRHCLPLESEGIEEPEEIEPADTLAQSNPE